AAARQRSKIRKRSFKRGVFSTHKTRSQFAANRNCVSQTVLCPTQVLPGAATVSPEPPGLSGAPFEDPVEQALAGRTRQRNVASPARNAAANTRHKDHQQRSHKLH